MSMSMEVGRIPAVTLGWRLKMSMDEMSRGEMAEILGVSEATVSRWCTDKGAAPKRAYLSQWALRPAYLLRG